VPGVERALHDLDNFDTENYDNPLAFFTKSINWTFHRKINAERKELYGRFKYLKTLDLEDGSHIDGRDETHYQSVYMDQEYMDEFIRNYEEEMRQKKEKAKERKQEQE